ncbi:hypothetical protein BVX97_05975 [bacterium E08(2017)]|nr:hypothetical protein BVX97_05975 [bacterium E08(2017)]
MGYDFSIITPSYNQLEYLKLAHASVADQEGVSFEHIVIDGNSTDETTAWLSEQDDIKWISEPDRSMYEAINKGLKMATGRICAYINCDEQYLPGALKRVQDHFNAHKDADIVYGDMIVTDPKGDIVAYRKSYPLHWWLVRASHFYIPSCTLFWKREIQEAGHFFPPQYRHVSDAEYAIDMLTSGYKASHLKDYTSIFTATGSNIGCSDEAIGEIKAAIQRGPLWVRSTRHLLVGLRRIIKLLDGAYKQNFPLEYDLYLPDNLAERASRKADQASFKWRAW